MWRVYVGRQGSPRRSFLGSFVVLSLILTSLIVGGAPLAAQNPIAPGPAQQASDVVLVGELHAIWGDTRPASNGMHLSAFLLFDEKGQATELLLDQETARPHGGPMALIKQRVRVEGEVIGTKKVKVKALKRDKETKLPATTPAATPINGSQPWVTILCRFADATDVTPHPTSWFEPLVGQAQPGMNHYWQEVSYNTINIDGSVVVGWYNLPQPRAEYLPDGRLNWGKALDDCTAAADPAVHFPNFVGINLIFNQDLDCCAWGGGGWLTRDGASRSYAVTWMPPWGWGNQSVLAHEMGHGFGLPHSSGSYDATYDSHWDPMSSPWRCSDADPQYGCVGVHTIAYHKDRLAWIPAARKYTATTGRQQLTLAPLEQSASGDDYLMAQIPIDGSTQFYTVEARRFMGYDTRLPGEAIVIHHVDPTRGDRLAQVVDSDRNGNPNDAGAMWLPGETFTDPAHNISVVVDEATDTGVAITIGRAKKEKARSVEGDAFDDTLKEHLPFDDARSTIDATIAEDDPIVSCLNRQVYNTIWYEFKVKGDDHPISITASTFGSDYDTTLAVYTGSRGQLSEVVCNDDSNGTLQSQVTFAATDDMTYYVMVGKFSMYDPRGILMINVSTP